MSAPFAHSFHALAGALAGDHSDWRWATDACADVDGFHRVLWARAEQLLQTKLSSQLGVEYDFFRDLCEQHAFDTRRALCTPRPDGSLHRVRYSTLYPEAVLQHGYWLSRGIKEGERLVIIGEPGTQYALALLTGLRAGLEVCIVPPRRPGYVQRRLAALAPDHLSVNSTYESWLGGFRHLLLPAVPETFPGPATPPDSWVYEADAPVLTVFNPYGPDSLTPLTLTAHQLFTALLRDVTLLLPIHPGDNLVALAEQHAWQPTLMLASWLGGAELWTEHQLGSLEALADWSPSMLFVDRNARDRLLASEDGLRMLGSVLRWFRDPAEGVGPRDLVQWSKFADKLASHGAVGANVVYAAAVGGSLLVSARASRPDLFRVQPCPGRAWQLSDLNGSGEPVVTGGGQLTLCKELTDDRAGRFVLSADGAGLMLSGSLDTWVAGTFYPAEEVEQVLTEHGLAESASAVMVPRASALHETSVTLVVFVDPRWASELSLHHAALSTAIRKAIEDELGAWALPDSVEVFPLMPEKKKDGQLDTTWVRRELFSNALRHKARRPVFVALAALQRDLMQLHEELRAEERAR